MTDAGKAPGPPGVPHPRTAVPTVAALDCSRAEPSDIQATARAGALRVILPEWSLWWSEGTPALLGLPAETIAGRAALETALGSEVALILSAALEDSMHTGGPVDIDLPLRDLSSGVDWIHLSGRSWRHEDGTTEVSCTLQGISGRKRLESEVAAAADYERRRLASELHDNLGQILVGTSLMLSSIARDARDSGSAMLPDIEQTIATLNSALRVCRTIAHGTESVVEGGLSRALQDLADRTTLTGVECVAVLSRAADSTLTNSRVIDLYRIAQEAITNALKHAQCRRVNLCLSVSGPILELVVSDDGRGAELLNGPSAGMGMRTMRYRAARTGGSFEVRSRPGTGTTIRVRTPLLP